MKNPNTKYWIVGGAIVAISAIFYMRYRRLKTEYSQEGQDKSFVESAPEASLANDELYVALGVKKSTDIGSIKVGSEGRNVGILQFAIKRITGKGSVDGKMKSSDVANFKAMYNQLGLKTPFDSAFMPNGTFVISGKNYVAVYNAVVSKFGSKLQNFYTDPEILKVFTKYSK